MAPSAELQLSPAESKRFGLRFARLNVPQTSSEIELDIEDLSGFDVVVVRQPAGTSQAWYKRTLIGGYRAVHADTLLYWERRDLSSFDRESVVDVAERSDLDELETMVRTVFADYDNHYAANPLLDPKLALDGYVEWAAATSRTTGGYVVVQDSDGPLGFGVVDWREEPCDIRLAGLMPRARGRNLYRELMAALMQKAKERGHDTMLISTQAQNIAVQRAWASLGWRPSSAFETSHLIRADLLDQVGRPADGT